MCGAAEGAPGRSQAGEWRRMTVCRKGFIGRKNLSVVLRLEVVFGGGG